MVYNIWSIKIRILQIMVSGSPPTSGLRTRMQDPHAYVALQKGLAWREGLEMKGGVGRV